MQCLATACSASTKSSRSVSGVASMPLAILKSSCSSRAAVASTKEDLEPIGLLGRRDVNRLHDTARTLKRLGRRLYGGRNFGVDRPKATLDQPTHPKRSIRRGCPPRRE